MPIFDILTVIDPTGVKRIISINDERKEFILTNGSADKIITYDIRHAKEIDSLANQFRITLSGKQLLKLSEVIKLSAVLNKFVIHSVWNDASMLESATVELEEIWRALTANSSEEILVL